MLKYGKRFYNIAQASLEECRYHLILARDLGYADTRSALDGLDSVGRQLYGYINALHRAKSSRQ
jgi:four helix bundle protein